MPANYPTAFDTMSDPSANLSGPPAHSTMHGQINDVIEAMQVELGLNPSGASATVAALLATLVGATARHGGRWTRAAVQSIPNGAATLITFDTELEDSDGFMVPPATNVVVPAGLGGVFGCFGYVDGLGGPTAAVARVLAGGLTASGVGDPALGRATAAMVIPLPVGGTVQLQCFQSTGVAVNVTAGLVVFRTGL